MVVTNILPSTNDQMIRPLEDLEDHKDLEDLDELVVKLNHSIVIMGKGLNALSVLFFKIKFLVILTSRGELNGSDVDNKAGMSNKDKFKFSPANEVISLLTQLI
jgi:hypothetical protein